MMSMGGGGRGLDRLGQRSCGREELSIRSTGLQEKDPVG